MKKAILFSLLTLTCTLGIAKEFPSTEQPKSETGVLCPWLPIFQEEMKEILFPNGSALNVETLGSRLPIKAFETSICCGCCNGFSHIGRYIHGTIVTIIGKEVGEAHEVQPILGEQTIYLNGNEVSRSATWAVESIGGMKYIVHSHPNCKVYSSQQSQFVIGE